MINALKKVNPDPSKLQDARARLRDATEGTKGYVGPYAMVSYTPDNHEGGVWESVIIGQMKDGRYQLIK